MVDVRDPTNTYTVLDNFTGDLRRGETGDTIIQGGATPVFIGSVDGPVKGTIVGPDLQIILNHDTATLFGDVVGSVRGDDSSILIDGADGSLHIQTFRPSGNAANIFNTTDNVNPVINMYRESSTDISNDGSINYGLLRFGRDDTNGPAVTALIAGRENALNFSASATSDFFDATTYFCWKEKQFGIGTITPAHTLDVQGNAAVTGYTQFGSLTSVERDALTAANGMVIYNTTNNKFEGYQNGSWINLDDGLAAA